jgi:hypothetical protein
VWLGCLSAVQRLHRRGRLDEIVDAPVYGSVAHNTNLVCRYALEFGQLEILKWARENGCPRDVKMCGAASYEGHFEIANWARENGYEWREGTCAAAARGARERLPVERGDVHGGGGGGKPRDTALGAHERLPIE